MEPTHTHYAAKSLTNGKKVGHGILNAKSAGKKMNPLIFEIWQTAQIIPTINLFIWKFFFNIAYRNNRIRPPTGITKANE